jgi:hypothetical protein
MSNHAIVYNSERDLIVGINALVGNIHSVLKTGQAYFVVVYSDT